MFFFARCAFCLMIVFYWMPWPQFSSGPARPSSDEMIKAISGRTGDIASNIINKAALKLGEGCAKAPAECLSHAPQIMQMVSVADGLDVIPPRRPFLQNERDPVHSGTRKPQQK